MSKHSWPVSSSSLFKASPFLFPWTITAAMAEVGPEYKVGGMQVAPSRDMTNLVFLWIRLEVLSNTQYWSTALGRRKGFLLIMVG